MEHHASGLWIMAVLLVVMGIVVVFGKQVTAWIRGWFR